MTATSLIGVGLLVVVGVLAAFVFPQLSIRRYFGKRQELTDDELLRLLLPAGRMPAETVLRLLAAVGSSYEIPYSKLRPEDCLISKLGKIDSWRFDAGAEKLERILRDEFGVGIPVGLVSFTIADLLKLVEVSKPADEPGK